MMMMIIFALLEGISVSNFLCAVMVNKHSHSMHTEKSFRNVVNPNQIWVIGNYHFPIDLAPIGTPIGFKSIGKW